MESTLGHRADLPLLTRTLFTNRGESEIEPLLEEARARAPGVTIRSDPRNAATRVWLEVVLASSDQARLDAAAAWLGEQLPGQATA